MFSKVRSSLARAIVLAPIFLAISGETHAQIPVQAGGDIVETTPNVIKKIGTYGTELVIESDVINERTPCKPSYPQSSIKNGETGAVTLRLMINTNGFVSRATVAETSGFRDLDRAAMIGFLGCKFKPPLTDGVPTAAWINMRYVWKIE